MNLSIEIYADGSKKEEMLRLAKHPYVRGFTTNPSLMKAAGVTHYENFSREMIEALSDFPISFEIFADEFTEMEAQARKIGSWGKNVFVKIPVTNSKGESTAELVKKLSTEGFKLNITAIFTLEQTWKVIRALEGGADSLISIFAGRIADTGVDPIGIMRAAVSMKTQPQMKILWASCREVFNIVEADRIGVDVITVPPKMIDGLASFGKDLNEYSLETVKTFVKDATAAGLSL